MPKSKHWRYTLVKYALSVAFEYSDQVKIQRESEQLHVLFAFKKR